MYSCRGGEGGGVVRARVCFVKSVVAFVFFSYSAFTLREGGEGDELEGVSRRSCFGNGDVTGRQPTGRQPAKFRRNPGECSSNRQQ